MSKAGLSLPEIAELTGAAARAGRSPTSKIVRVGAIQDADAQTLVFAETDRAASAASASAAGAILVPVSLAGAEDERFLRVADPRHAFAVCARRLRELARDPLKAAEIHPSAVVDVSATVGAGARIGAGAVIEAGVTMGDDVFIGSNAVVREGVVLGSRVVVQSGAVLGSTGFGYVRHRGTGEYLLFPQQGRLVIEDDVEIGANTTIDRGALEETRIGRGTKIDNLVHIGHNCCIGRHVVIAAQVGISGSCVVEDGAILAGQVGISDHCHIGPGVVLGGQAGVYRGKHVEGAGEVFSGTPAEPLKHHMRALAVLRGLVRSRKP